MEAGFREELQARAELYLCLSRSFLAPREPALAEALRTALAPDLREMGAALALEIAAAVADFEAEIARMQGPAQLLQAYSAIFVAPPVAAFINAGQYMDGAVDGGSVRAIEQAYLRCGLARDEGFRDLADHLSVVLEFVAALYARQADGAPDPLDPGHFLHAYVLPWVARFAADVAAASQSEALPCNPYRGLAAVLLAAVQHDAVAPEVDAKLLRHQRALQRARARHAGKGISAEDLAEIRQKLQARGLSTSHLPPSPQEADRRVAAALGAA
jgi:TorA maturation chaperone TorD